MAELLPFPADHLTGRARHVAAMVDKRRPGRERDAYFRTICKNLAGQLRRAGLPEAVVQDQIARFTAAVNRCIAEGWHFERPAPVGHQPDLFDQPGGAA